MKVPNDQTKALKPKRIRFSLTKKTKTGVIKHRYTYSFGKAINWLKREPFETLKIKCVWGWGSNMADFDSIHDAEYFLRWNWEDFKHDKGAK